MKDHETDPLFRENTEIDETVGMSASFEDWVESLGPEAVARIEALNKEWDEREARGEDVSDIVIQMEKRDREKRKNQGVNTASRTGRVGSELASN